MEIDPIKAIHQLEFTLDTANLSEQEKNKQKQNLQALAQVVNEWNKLKKDSE